MLTRTDVRHGGQYRPLTMAASSALSFCQAVSFEISPSLSMSASICSSASSTSPSTHPHVSLMLGADVFGAEGRADPSCAWRRPSQLSILRACLLTGDSSGAPDLRKSFTLRINPRCPLRMRMRRKFVYSLIAHCIIQCATPTSSVLA